MNSFFEEVEKFSGMLDMIMPNAIKNIKHQVIELHSTTTEYEDFFNGHFSTMREVQVPAIVEGIEVKVWINKGSFYSFINDNSDTNNSYSLMSSVKTNKGGIADGNVCWLIWEVVKSDIDLSMYPNFKPPTFTSK